MYKAMQTALLYPHTQTFLFLQDELSTAQNKFATLCKIPLQSSSSNNNANCPNSTKVFYAFHLSVK